MTSVIIPTYQGEAKISNCIDSLLKQSNTNFEIIIAIDGSSDNTESIALEKLKGFDSFKIIKQENKGRAAIRNYGARSAKGDVLIFYDDDTRPSVDSVLIHENFHNEHIDSVLQGSVISDETKMTKDIQRYKTYLERKWEDTLISDSGIIDDTYLSAANFSIPKKIFESIEGFDEKLNDCEDFELSTRLRDSNVPVYYDALNYAYHDDFISCANYIERKRDYAKAHKSLMKNNPSRFKKYDHRNFLPRRGLKKLIYRCLSSKRLVEMIDNEHFCIMMLPNNIRYKLYDLTIQSLSQYFPNKTIS